MAAFEWMICLDEGGNADGPEFEGPRDQKVWSLYSQDPDVNVPLSLRRVTPKVTGPHFGELKMYRYGHGFTYFGADRLALWLEFKGDPIGG